MPRRGLPRSHTGNGSPEHHWADYIQQMCLYEDNLRLIFPCEPEPYQIALMKTLGVTWVVRTRAERRAGIIRGAQRLEALSARGRRDNEIVELIHRESPSGLHSPMLCPACQGDVAEARDEANAE